MHRLFLGMWVEVSNLSFITRKTDNYDTLSPSIKVEYKYLLYSMANVAMRVVLILRNN